MKDRPQLRAALALAEVRGLGPRLARRLVDACGSPAAVLEAFASGRGVSLGEDLVGARRGALGGKLVDRLRRLRPVPAGRLEGLERAGTRVVAYGVRGYPSRLAQLYDPPVVLYLAGPVDPAEGRAVAVVGTRKATEYGRRVARELAAGLAGQGWTVVSGMARGIDGAAHRGALRAGGRTVGVLGSGLDHRFPWENRGLYAEMRQRGCLVSEFPPPEPPRAWLFPRRNRIIAALAEAVVVVQAGRRSGAMNTVDHALDLGRDVLAVPGPVGPQASAGVHRLLQEGAGLATGAEDVLRELGVALPGPASWERAAPAGGGSAREASGAEAVRRRLREGPALADELASATGLPPGPALALLSRLEVEGKIRALPGGRYEMPPGAGGLRAHPERAGSPGARDEGWRR